MALVVLVALFWPSFTVEAATTKKKTAVRKTVKRASAKRKVVPAKSRRRIAPSQPRKFATVPVQTELKACSMKEHQAADSVLCLNCADQALSTAKAFTGLRYKRGGTDPNIGFDCSGFVRHVFASSCGRDLPRTAREQFELGESVEKEELQRGDLVFFASRQGWHVGIYTGDNSFIHSPNRRDSIRTSSLDTPFWSKTYKGARRLTTDISPALLGDASAIPTN